MTPEQTAALLELFSRLLASKITQAQYDAAKAELLAQAQAEPKG